MPKLKVLFVGSFLNKSKSGGVGGQMFACTSLVNSSLGEQIEWTLIDTTAESNLKIPFYKKLPKVLNRFIRFLYYIVFFKYDHILIFSSNGLSLLEKGSMAVIANKITNAKIIFAPRSGRLLNEINSKKIKFIKKVFKSSDKVICQGKSWKNIFLEKVNCDRKKYIVQKNWIPVENYSFNKNKNNDIIKILFLAWLDKDKGILDLIEAASYLRSKNIENFIFIIAGKGKDEIEFKEIVGRMKLEEYFEFKGWVIGEEKFKLFDENQIFVLPSYFEGMPNSLLESMASGLACIASNVGSIGDIIDGNNGNMFDRDKPKEFLYYLENLILNPKERIKMGLKANEYIKKNHSLKEALKNFEKNIFN